MKSPADLLHGADFLIRKSKAKQSKAKKQGQEDGNKQWGGGEEESWIGVGQCSLTNLSTPKTVQGIQNLLANFKPSLNNLHRFDTKKHLK